MIEKIYPKLKGYPDYMGIEKSNENKGLIGYIKCVHTDAEGNEIWHNATALINLGEEHMLKGWFQGLAASIPSGFKLNLATDATIDETASTFTAVTGTGYAEVAITRDATDWTASKPADSWQVASKECDFTATAGTTWSTAKTMVLEATLNSSDTLIAYATLTVDRNIAAGEKLTASIILTLE